MKIAIVRGDFAAPAELPNFFPLSGKSQLALFTGKFPVWNLGNTKKIVVKKLLSPVDLNLGKISRIKMAFLNRAFTDAHVLFGLENKLRGFDIAHCAESYYSFTQQCISAKEKGNVSAIVSTVWENIPFNNEGISGRKEFKNRAFEKIDKFLAVTKRARDVLIEEGCDPKKIEVLMPGVDLSVFKKTKDSFHFPKKLEGKTKLLFSGRLIPEKGILELLEFYAELKKENSKLSFIIAGEGQLSEEIKEKILKEKITDVHLLGKISYFDMPKLYSSCDFLLHFPVGSTTWQEQYGMALIEAMACGLPILGLDQGSIADVVGSGGIVASRENFFAELEKILMTPEKLKKMSAKAEKFAKAKYDSRMYAKNLERIYLELLK